MFTGIIEAVGQIEKIENKSGDAKFTINTGSLDLSDVALGDSIACNGVCLTVIEQSANSYTADVSAETLTLTTLANIKVGSKVNLEKALTPTTRLGGHLVSGHVDGIGKVVAIQSEARSVKYDIEAPQSLAKYIAKKGSITVDGISLTVNEIDHQTFSLNIVPHTQQNTNLVRAQIGTQVNLEVDLLARYVERLITAQGEQTAEQKDSNLNYDLLAKSGFIR